MTLEEEVGRLRAENARLRQEAPVLRQENAALREQVQGLAGRVAELEQRGQPRRAGSGGRGPATDGADRVSDASACALPGLRVRAAGRQVSEIPPPPVVTEHVFVRRWCPYCARYRRSRPEPDSAAAHT